jgi:hypothetical protein
MPMHDTDPWTDTGVPDWSGEAHVQFDASDPGKTIPLSWAQDMMQRWYKRNPSQFGAKLGEVVADWSARAYNGSEGK